MNYEFIVDFSFVIDHFRSLLLNETAIYGKQARFYAHVKWLQKNDQLCTA
jgi:hypothetical protein